MDKWMTDWQDAYKEICTLIEKGDTNHVWIELNKLEQKSAKVLDLWSVMDEKVALIKEHLAHEPSVNGYQSMGTVYLEQNQLKRAVLSLEQEQAEGVNEEWRRLFLAYAHLMNGSNNQTIEQFMYLIQTAKDESVRHFSFAGLGCYYTVNHQVDRAAELFEQAKLLTPTSDVVYNLGVCYYLIGAMDVSAEHFEQYTKHVQQDGEALCFHGLVRARLDQFEHAKQLWERALEVYTTSEDMIRLALMSEWYGFFEIAIKCYQKVIALGEEETFAMHGLAWNLALNDQLRLAWPIFDRLLKEHPHDPHVRRSLQHLGKLAEEKNSMN
ncbi:hypothetical protein [Alkalicoccobacillus gibsonii]|jgi:tetratricopeptide (TPR) repeat protein|uniref:hypothetical protein n=1 Tax=Alkalicoccobacillus gibsonii TaxID=79881 RepID=UPI0035166EAD